MRYIIKSNEIDQMEGLAKTHFLNENAKRMNKSLGDMVGLKNLGFHIIEVEPGNETTEYHVHFLEDECTYVLSGRATVTIDGTDYEVEAGDFIGYPAGGLPHTMKNTGSELLRCIVVGQRLPIEGGDYPNLGKRFYRFGDAIDLVDIENVQKPGPNVGKKI